MKKNFKTKKALAGLALLLLAQFGFAQVQLPKLVKDSMVLQRDANIKVWGWASAGEKVSISFRGKRYKTTAGNDGKWSVALAPAKAGGPFTMKIDASNHIELKDILVGDVWLCAGQSNMVHQMELHRITYEKDIAEANNPNIRQFYVPNTTNLEGPQKDLSTGSWKWANPQDVRQFSAVAYFFAKTLYDKYRIPIGLINASVGGTPIEAWMSEEGFEDFPSILQTIKRNKDSAYVNSVNRRAAAINNSPKTTVDKGLTASTPWYQTSYVPKGWQNITVPGYWEDQGVKDLNGVVWYRKEITVPANMLNAPATLFLGRIVDADVVYLNGQQIGNTTYQYPQRRYSIPSGVLKEGKNILTVRVINNGGKGGFVPDKPYNLAAGAQTIDLNGTWQYKVGEAFERQGGYVPSISAQNQPTALYNAMVAPYTNYNIKGILWYQGESNSGQPDLYARLLPALIKDWRKKFNDNNLPFLIAQLPNYMDATYYTTESNWAAMREAQSKALAVPNTGLAVTIDLGEWNDIHPDNKKDVGYRLALSALKVAYGEKDAVTSGPTYESIKKEDGKLVLSFFNSGSGLTTSDGEALNYFSVAGEDKKFEWATAKIEGDKVVVWSDKVQHPVYVRYAWADNPFGANFSNKEGLPASPFQAQIDAPAITAATPWKGKKSAVCLTYDDALNVHLDNALPLLDSLGFKATFYLSGYSGVLGNRMSEWRRVAATGHELGNHTLFHPCTGNRPGREFVTPEYDLGSYTFKRITDEIKMTNTVLKALDGKEERTFAYPCGDTKIGDSLYLSPIKNEFTGARGVSPSMPSVKEVNLYNISCYTINGQTGEELINLVKKGIETKTLVVFLFHGVGGEHGLNVSLPAHRQLLKFLKTVENDVWIAPAVDIASFVKNQQI